MLVVVSSSLQCTEDGVEKMNDELWSGQEESHQEDGQVGQYFLDVSPVLLRERLSEKYSLSLRGRLFCLA